MAITAYSGLQGSGKSYEVVKNVILSNLLAGRRIVTNIYGLKDDDIKNYLVERYKIDDVGKLGQIVHVSNEDITLPYFFPWEGQDSGVPLRVSERVSPFKSAVDVLFNWATVPDAVPNHSIVQGGDVIVLDEVWRWYATGEKMLPEHMKFFRMHRHFLDAKTGVSCDVVLIIQVLDDLQNKVKKVVEKNFQMTKHKGLGFDNRYVVNVYGGYRQTEKALIESHQESYQPEFYNLYESYSQAKGNKLPSEKAADSRGKLWNRWQFKVGLPVALICIPYSFWYMYNFFHPKPKTAVVSGSASGQTSAVSGVASASPAAPSVPKPPEVSDKWRVVGVYSVKSQTVFMLVNDKMQVRKLVNVPFKFSLGDYEVQLPNGDFASTWSGAAAVNQRMGMPR
jgi:zona occludens toxin